MQHQNTQMERWSVERTADRQSLGSELAVVGKRIGDRSRLSGANSGTVLLLSSRDPVTKMKLYSLTARRRAV